jgi:hypothetical protein
MTVSETIVKTLDDKRPIYWVGTPTNWEGEAEFMVGQGGVTKILAYGENGEMAEVTWLAIYQGEGVWVRLPASQCTGIGYRLPVEDVPTSNPR